MYIICHKHVINKIKKITCSDFPNDVEGFLSSIAKGIKLQSS